MVEFIAFIVIMVLIISFPVGVIVYKIYTSGNEKRFLAKYPDAVKIVPKVNKKGFISYNEIIDEKGNPAVKSLFRVDKNVKGVMILPGKYTFKVSYTEISTGIAGTKTANYPETKLILNLAPKKLYNLIVDEETKQYNFAEYRTSLDGKLLFEIKGDSNNYFRAFSDGFMINFKNSNKIVDLSKVVNIFIDNKELDGGVDRVAHIGFMVGAEMFEFKLDNKTFDGIVEKLEEVFNNEWADVHMASDTVKWCSAITAVAFICADVNPKLYLMENPTSDIVRGYRNSLSESWSINNGDDLLDSIKSLYDGYQVQEFNEEYENRESQEISESRLDVLNKINALNEKSIWAWDLQRVLYLCSLGYASGYISVDNMLHWSVKAGEKLQSIYDGWEDYMESYLLGYGFWSNTNPDLKGDTANYRRIIYNEASKYKYNPWEIPWNCELRA